MTDVDVKSLINRVHYIHMVVIPYCSYDNSSFMIILNRQILKMYYCNISEKV